MFPTLKSRLLPSALSVVGVAGSNSGPKGVRRLKTFSWLDAPEVPRRESER